MMRVFKNIDVGLVTYIVADYNGREHHVLMKDKEIAKCIGMKPQEYRDKMINEFGAVINGKSNRLAFTNFTNATKVLEWINPLYEPHYIFAKLAGWRENE